MGIALKRRPSRVYPSDMRVKIPGGKQYFYPDASVVCSKPAFDEEAERDTLTNPLVIFEVLSDSTEKYDRGQKFGRYRTIPSLAEVVLVSQKEAVIEHYARQADGSWVMREWRAGQRLALPALDCAIDVDEIYLKVFAEAYGGQGAQQ